MNEKLLDVFITTYNRADYLKPCIESVLRQTYQEFDLYILDNASTDHTQEVVSCFTDSRLHYIKRERNIGGTGNLNDAYGRSKKKYFVIFHDDDVMGPYFLEKELSILEQDSSIDCVSCISEGIDEHGNLISTGMPLVQEGGTMACSAEEIRKCAEIEEYQDEGKLEIFEKDTLFHDYLFRQQYICYPTLMYRTEFIRKHALRLDASAGPSADIKLCFDIGKSGGRLAIFREPLIHSRHHASQDSVMNRMMMLEKLFNYLREDPYYSPLLFRERDGQKAYFRRMLFDTACMCTSGKITPAQAKHDGDIFRNILEHAFYDVAWYKMFLILIRICPNLVKIIYRKGKQRRMSAV